MALYKKLILDVFKKRKRVCMSLFALGCQATKKKQSCLEILENEKKKTQQS